MTFITVLADDRDLDGHPHKVRHEAPKDEQGRTALGYLKSSAEGVSDQRWIYDTAEAAKLSKTEPDRFVQAEG